MLFGAHSELGTLNHGKGIAIGLVLLKFSILFLYHFSEERSDTCHQHIINTLIGNISHIFKKTNLAAIGPADCNAEDRAMKQATHLSVHHEQPSPKPTTGST